MGRLPLSPEVGYVGLSPVKHGGVSIDFQRGCPDHKVRDGGESLLHVSFGVGGCGFVVLQKGLPELLFCLM